MNNKLFDHLVLSLKEAGAIKRDEGSQCLGCPILEQFLKKMEQLPTEFSDICMSVKNLKRTQRKLFIGSPSSGFLI